MHHLHPIGFQCCLWKQAACIICRSVAEAVLLNLFVTQGQTVCPYKPPITMRTARGTKMSKQHTLVQSYHAPCVLIVSEALARKADGRCCGQLTSTMRTRLTMSCFGAVSALRQHKTDIILIILFLILVVYCTWRRLSRGPVPISVNYHFTRKCNKECGFCFHTAKTSHVASSEEAKHGLSLLKKAGMRKLSFAGGEPFLYPKHLGMCDLRGSRRRRSYRFDIWKFPA